MEKREKQVTARLIGPGAWWFTARPQRSSQETVVQAGWGEILLTDVLQAAPPPKEYPDCETDGAW